MQEPVLVEYLSSQGCDGAKTLNAYGAEVLNCESMLIVDVDLVEQGTDKCVVVDSEDLALTVLRELTRHEKLAWRIYRTAGGLRYIETSREWVAYWGETDRIQTALFADPLYRMLCRKQETFRARLTPKPWRSDLYYDRWDDPLKGYRADDGDEAVCDYVGSIGSGEVHSPFQQLIADHDLVTKATDKHRNQDIEYHLT